MIRICQLSIGLIWGVWLAIVGGYFFSGCGGDGGGAAPASVPVEDSSSSVTNVYCYFVNGHLVGEVGDEEVEEMLFGGGSGEKDSIVINNCSGSVVLDQSSEVTETTTIEDNRHDNEG